MLIIPLFETMLFRLVFIFFHFANVKNEIDYMEESDIQNQSNVDLYIRKDPLKDKNYFISNQELNQFNINKIITINEKKTKSEYQKIIYSIIKYLNKNGEFTFPSCSNELKCILLVKTFFIHQIIKKESNLNSNYNKKYHFQYNYGDSLVLRSLKQKINEKAFVYALQEIIEELNINNNLNNSFKYQILSIKRNGRQAHMQILNFLEFFSSLFSLIGFFFAFFGFFRIRNTIENLQKKFHQNSYMFKSCEIFKNNLFMQSHINCISGIVSCIYHANPHSKLFQFADYLGVFALCYYNVWFNYWKINFIKKFKFNNYFDNMKENSSCVNNGSRQFSLKKVKSNNKNHLSKDTSDSCSTEYDDYEVVVNDNQLPLDYFDQLSDTEIEKIAETAKNIQFKNNDILNQNDSLLYDEKSILEKKIETNSPKKNSLDLNDSNLFVTKNMMIVGYSTVFISQIRNFSKPFLRNADLFLIFIGHFQEFVIILREIKKKINGDRKQVNDKFKMKIKHNNEKMKNQQFDLLFRLMCYKIITITSSIITEYLDFPPIYFIFDSHSLWHFFLCFQTLLHYLIEELEVIILFE